MKFNLTHNEFSICSWYSLHYAISPCQCTTATHTRVAPVTYPTCSFISMLICANVCLLQVVSRHAYQFISGVYMTSSTHSVCCMLFKFFSCALSMLALFQWNLLISYYLLDICICICLDLKSTTNLAMGTSS